MSAASQEQTSAQQTQNLIVDFRIRPPYKGFLKTLNYRGNSSPPSIEAFMGEMDEAGVDKAVVLGRQTPPSMRYRGSWGLPYGSVPNDDIAELVEKYPQRLIAFAGINGATGDQALAEIDRCRQMGFKGIALDNGWGDPPLVDDDPQLFPIYEKCQEEKMIVAITSSIAVGPDMDYSKPIGLQRLGVRFRELKMVVPHACWPWVSLACAAAFRNPNLHLIPDYYIGMPGANLYVEWANGRLQEQILYASSYPGSGLKDGVERYSKLEFESEAIRRKVMGGNAARLLGL
jgi:predicted TIM-barrel fold metal-dependent hydrolase